uniref:Probable arginine--tRNA ligase, mitochondrial n=1 Tax=Timema shepardi TaxID=629360 RepID=A0A7R9B5G2_TIMSH|nr:unnamed protein product [Timema shepardi]
MASKLKINICSRVLDAIRGNESLKNTSSLLSRQLFISLNKNGGDVEVQMPINIFHNHFQSPLSENKTILSVSEIKKLFNKTDFVTDVQELGEGNGKKIVFRMNKHRFLKDVLEDILDNSKGHRTNSSIRFPSFDEKIVVEYSSPNIAKPFHMGHLRSTIIGNFISNLHEHLGGKVVRINYLGDWGTQFGLLQVGLNMSNYTDEMIKHNPIQLLYQAYVTANQAAQNDSALGAKAREIFKSLEEGSFADIKKWENYRNYTVDELQRIYKRLGVTFDEYEWESMYSTVQIKNVLDQLEEKGILKLEEDGRKVVNLDNNRRATLVKSDGTTLYLTRDIAAALHRYDRHSFDRLLYVVENGQNDHFTALMGTMKQMDLFWAERMRHVKFGRIRGMSTRKGSVVFLKDVLDETRDLMHKKQLESPNTRIDLRRVSDTTSDILGVSAVIVNDLKQRRQRDYEFDWNKALQLQGDTGTKLQYTHCRLYSLEQNCGAQLPTECDPSVLQETEAVLLVVEVARFDEVLNKSHEELEACVLVSYLFRLCNLTNQAFKVLRIKDQDPHIASQRLLLFHSSRRVLQQGMNILGLKPLNEM